MYAIILLCWFGRSEPRHRSLRLFGSCRVRGLLLGGELRPSILRRCNLLSLMAQAVFDSLSLGSESGDYIAHQRSALYVRTTLISYYHPSHGCSKFKRSDTAIQAMESVPAHLLPFRSCPPFQPPMSPFLKFPTTHSLGVAREIRNLIYAFTPQEDYAAFSITCTRLYREVRELHFAVHVIKPVLLEIRLGPYANGFTTGKYRAAFRRAQMRPSAFRNCVEKGIFVVVWPWSYLHAKYPWWNCDPWWTPSKLCRT